jgi:hypothetical protein
MKRILLPILVLSLSIFACSIPGNSSIATDSPLPVSTTETSAPPTDIPVGVQANVICGQLSFYLDLSLASGYDCQTISESSGADMPAFAVNPEYTEITLTGYVLPGSSLGPRIDIFPVQRFTELLPDVIPGRVLELQALLTGGAPAGDHLPILPVFNAGQLFRAAYAVLPFGSGNGIRFLTMYGQDYGPVNNMSMVYSFEGLTSDGKNWVAVILPVSNPILPSDGSTLPGGESWDQFYANFPTYVVDIQNQLNAQSSDSYVPTMGVLDVLVSSITVVP